MEELLVRVELSTLRRYTTVLDTLGLDDGQHDVLALKQRLAKVSNVNTRRGQVIALRAMFPELRPYLKIEETVPRVYDLSLIPAEIPHDTKHTPMLLMKYAGLRLGEALAITHTDVRGNRLLVTKSLCQDTNSIKSVKTRADSVIIPTWLAEHLEGYEGVNMLPNSYFKWMKRHYNVNPHSLRHHYATTLIQSGVSPEMVRRQLRHAKLETTLKIYAQLSQNDIANEIERVFPDTLQNAPEATLTA